MARLLTVPAGYSDVYSPSTIQLQILAAVLGNTNAAINQAAESFSDQYQSMDAVVAFIESGGIYIDYCGWPMFWSYVQNFTSGSPNPQRFGQFLTAIGADRYYCLGFNSGDYCIGTYDRSWLSTQNISNPYGLIYGTGGVSCTGYTAYTAYPMVAVKSASGKGIYFYGAAGSTGAIDPTQFGRFILSVIPPVSGGSGSGNNSGGGGCPAGYTSNSTGGCVPLAGISQQQCVAGGGTWENGICYVKGGSVTPPKTIDWPLIIGGGALGLGLIMGLVLLGGK